MLKYGRPLSIILVSQVAFWACFLLLTATVGQPDRLTETLLPIIVIVASVTLGGIALALLPLTQLGDRQWSGAALLLLLAADAFMTSFSGPAWLLWRYIVQYLMIAAAVLFVQSLAGRRLREVRVLLPLMVAIVDALTNLHVLPWRGLWATMLFPPVLILWIGFELAHHGFAIHAEANALTRELRRNVARQATEISDAEARIREQEHLVAINVERQRLVRDMHDGAGGLLTRLLLRLRSGDVPSGEVREEIQAAVDDLRQIIDSMDCADEGLDVALAIFRERIAPRLMHEGVTLAWRDEATRPLPLIAAPHMIQIYRILQESMTNVLKHARASSVAMDLANDAEGRVRLSLSDNGIGFAPSAEGERPRWQRGLTNMARRAQIIDARLDIQSSPGQGTRIALTLAEPALP